MVRKSELERVTITELTVLCLQRGLDPTGDKDTLIARLLGKEKPKPEPDVAPEPPEPGSEPPEAKAEAEARAEAEAKAEAEARAEAEAKEE